METQARLSKGVLQLKFMKKTKEKFEKQEDEEEREELYNSQLSNLQQSGVENVSVVPSHYDCHEYLPCRLSFGGHDEQMEKINVDKLKGIYTALRSLVWARSAATEQTESMDAEDGEDQKESDVNNPATKPTHKNTKANRFDPKPFKKKDPKFRKDNTEKFDKRKRNTNREDNGSFKQNNRGRDNKTNEDKKSHKRKSDGFNDHYDNDKPKMKFLKPQD